MFPRLSQNGAANRLLDYSKHLREAFLVVLSRFVSGSDKIDLLGIELGEMRPFASGAPSLANHVTGIVRSCSKPQVVRAYAWPVVAGVENAKGVRDCTEVNNPRRLVRVDLVSGAACDVAVSLPRFRRRPYPARGFWILGRNKNLVPKSEQEGVRESLRQQVRFVKNWLRKRLSWGKTLGRFVIHNRVMTEFSGADSVQAEPRYDFATST